MKLSPEILELNMHDVVSTPVGGEKLATLTIRDEDGVVRDTRQAQLSRPEAGRLHVRIVDDRYVPRDEPPVAKTKKVDPPPPPPPAPPAASEPAVAQTEVLEVPTETSAPSTEEKTEEAAKAEEKSHDKHDKGEGKKHKRS